MHIGIRPIPKEVTYPTLIVISIMYPTSSIVTYNDHLRENP